MITRNKKTMDKETLLTCLIALKADLYRCEKALQNKEIEPINSAVPRIKKAISIIEIELNK